ncbi:hypothetical protein AXF42_Ash021795 [Apostasia shenzhenica]|uniref:Uncharacterized protein n=1 Tax=Apostasia shenzhenica TaxID=1088818 RepID=A0A2H9ZRV2_9ASPA|nr:hypothetical protein AXF42_Ash021795 [Apostasia shenzhenica]
MTKICGNSREDGEFAVGDGASESEEVSIIGDGMHTSHAAHASVGPSSKAACSSGSRKRSRDSSNIVSSVGLGKLELKDRLLVAYEKKVELLEQKMEKKEGIASEVNKQCLERICSIPNISRNGIVAMTQYIKQDDDAKFFVLNMDEGSLRMLVQYVVE